MPYIKLEELQKFPIRKDHYDKEHGNEHFIYGVETVFEYAEYLPTYDVVPRAELEQLQHKYELAVAERAANVAGFIEQLSRSKAKVARDICEEIRKDCGYSVASQNGVELYHTKQYYVNAMRLDELESKYADITDKSVKE